MVLSNPAAFAPFLGDLITLRETLATGSSIVSVKALVMDTDSSFGSLGWAESGFKTSVVYEWSSLPRLVTIGSTVDADPLGRWSKLTVQKSFRLGGLGILLCSSQEVAY